MARPLSSRRGFSALLLAACAALLAPSPAPADEAAAWAALSAGGVVVFRHAIAPGTGDPPGFRLDDCATQRNLSEAGRAQARRIGAAFRARGIAVGRVVTSPWCRARETADLAFPGQRRDEPAVASFFGDRARGPERTAAALTLLRSWTGPGALVAVSHQVNITALTGVFPASGEGVVLRFGSGGGAEVVGRLRFD